MVFDHVCGARNCSARCRFAQFRPLHPRFGRSSRHRRRSLTRLSCRSPALGQIFLCQIKMHPYGVHFYLAEKERFELSRRLSRPTPLAGAPLRPLEYFSEYGKCGRPVASNHFYNYTQKQLICQSLNQSLRDNYVKKI